MNERTPPERGEEGANVVGRPAVERPSTAFHEQSESVDEERKPLDADEALREGGSFDGLGAGASADKE